MNSEESCTQYNMLKIARCLFRWTGDAGKCRRGLGACEGVVRCGCVGGRAGGWGVNRGRAAQNRVWGVCAFIAGSLVG